ncbi:thiamine diphosphokinase [Rhodobacterales bacterium HKCCSP123]|nr:thiamine diphosphokinase [Rhodobacterales bacterium HKCCSP123]
MGNNVPRFESGDGVTLLGGGALGEGDLSLSLSLAPRLVAADGGAATALAAGHMPEAVYGDMDSLADEARARIPADRVHAIPEQESTDFDKALRQIRAPVILAVGFTGARIDHELAVYHVLAARAASRCIVLGAEDMILHAPPRLMLDLPRGTRLSIFPLAPVTGRSRGLEWQIDGLRLDPLGRIGTSNRSTGAPVELTFDGPGALLILPRTELRAVFDAVAGASVWSRPAGVASL